MKKTKLILLFFILVLAQKRSFAQATVLGNILVLNLSVGIIISLSILRLS
jgi:hypothetical protein